MRYDDATYYPAAGAPIECCVEREVLCEADLLGAIRARALIEYRSASTQKLTAVRADVAVDLVNAINEQDTDFNAELVRAYAHGPGALYKLIAKLMRKELADDVAFYNERDGRIVEAGE